MTQRPYWRLPKGVTRGEWEYFHSIPVARDFDNYFSCNELFDYDVALILSKLDGHPFGRGGVVADLGCGTGRALVPLVEAGYQGLAIDLSPHMLSVVAEKSVAKNLTIHRLRANLVELDGVRDEAVDHALSMFSTLGMIVGGDHRQSALDHVCRILRPNGLFILHVHNRWFNLYDPGGPKWLLNNWFRSRFVSDVELGDKYFDYRGVHNMYLHVFSRGEITRMLRTAGFRICEMVPLEARRRRPLRVGWLCQGWRANGWIITAEKIKE